LGLLSAGSRGLLRAVRGWLECNLCQKRLRLSWKVDECKPLRVGRGRLLPHPGKAVQAECIKNRFESAHGFSA
jgi:hypothetical protein